MLCLTMCCTAPQRPADGPPQSPASAPASEDLLPADAVSGAALSNDGTYFVTYMTVPDPIPLNQMFSIDVRVYDGASPDAPANDITLRADGRMPAHRHGMNTSPGVEQIGPGHFRVRGMLFHMSGDWELDFDIERGGLVERAQFAVTLE
jgi:hypothetical protein